MKLEEWDELNARYQIALSRVSSLPRHTTRDCRRMGDTVAQHLRAADAERVNCRRRTSVSLIFEHHMQLAIEALTNFEGHVIFAALMREPE